MKTRYSAGRYLPCLLLLMLASGLQASMSFNVSSNFNGTAIPQNDYIWFNSVFKPSAGLGVTDPSVVHIQITGASLGFTDPVSLTSYNLSVPNSLITLDKAATQASVSFDTILNQWNIIAPGSYTGNIFFGGLAFLVPAGGLSGGINPVTWSGTVSTDSPNDYSFQWQWAAAVYTSLSTSYTSLGVKSVDSNTLDASFHNSDHAGTPENFTADVIGGARGGGGSNFTGSYSATQSLTIEGGGTGQAVPEPGTASLFVLGLLLVVGGVLRRC